MLSQMFLRVAPTSDLRLTAAKRTPPSGSRLLLLSTPVLGHQREKHPTRTVVSPSASAFVAVGNDSPSRRSVGVAGERRRDGSLAILIVAALHHLHHPRPQARRARRLLDGKSAKKNTLVLHVGVRVFRNAHQGRRVVILVRLRDEVCRGCIGKAEAQVAADTPSLTRNRRDHLGQGLVAAGDDEECVATIGGGQEPEGFREGVPSFCMLLDVVKEVVDWDEVLARRTVG
uniref:Uncharacterized protein n=1 Tax=Mycena chlorophos TaxID=658473 RepID=A0ABQ0KXD0_MYCCL|nr:predicted protein [Mycena chlorophos]